MAADRHHLTVKLDGGRADQHRVGAADLATLASVVQKAVRAVAAVLADAPVSARGGRTLSSDLRADTELEIIAAPRPGSFAVDMELAPRDGAQIGEDALATLVDGLDWLRTAEESPELPPGFDRSVLKAVTPLGKLFGPNRGYSSVSLSLNGAVAPRQTLLDARVVHRLKQRERTPYDAPAKVEGVLRMIEGRDHPTVCRVDREGLPSVTCRVPEGLWTEAGAAYGHYVRISGMGHFLPGSDEPKSMVADTLVRLPGRPLPPPETYRLQLGWREQADAESNVPVLDVEAVAVEGLFESDEDLDDFLSSVKP